MSSSSLILHISVTLRIKGKNNNKKKTKQNNERTKPVGRKMGMTVKIVYDNLRDIYKLFVAFLPDWEQAPSNMKFNGEN